MMNEEGDNNSEGRWEGLCGKGGKKRKREIIYLQSQTIKEIHSYLSYVELNLQNSVF